MRGRDLQITLKIVFLRVNNSAMSSFESLYNKIEYNIKAALLKMADLQRDNADLRRRNEELERQGQALRLQMQELAERVKIIVVTKTVFDKKDKQETKKQINDWVREIDKCIGRLANK